MRRHWQVVPLVGWTLLLWVTRLRNALQDDELIGGQRWRALIVAGLFVGAALVVGGGVLWRRRMASLRETDRLMIGVFAVGSMLYWAIRAVQIALADHSAAFIVVHTVLGVGSVLFGLLALAGVRAGTGAVEAPGPFVPRAEEFSR